MGYADFHHDDAPPPPKIEHDGRAAPRAIGNVLEIDEERKERLWKAVCDASRS